jgi:[acyl-carrier-protein] S-malonyltransferase
MLDAARTAFVFPGQGSQFVGMGQALAQASPAARQTFEAADDCLGFALSRLCWEGPEADLTDTVNAQPALLACSIAALRALLAELGEFTPALMAGHSLGEITALVAAGALEFEDGLALVRTRGEVMKAAGQQTAGGMAAILNLETPELAAICAEASAATGGVVQVANDNCPGQVVISGDNAALDKAMELAKARGAKRALRLPVSIAAHSPLMQPALTEFTAAVEAVPFISPVPPVVGNIHAAPLTDPNAIRAELPAQLTSPVRWTESVRAMLGQGVTTFVELGAKDVLTGLLKRIEPSAVGRAVGTPEGLKALLEPAQKE